MYSNVRNRAGIQGDGALRLLHEGACRFTVRKTTASARRRDIIRSWYGGSCGRYVISVYARDLTN